jgi:hypothetical protein
VGLPLAGTFNLYAPELRHTAVELRQADAAVLLVVILTRGPQQKLEHSPHVRVLRLQRGLG